MRRVLWVLLQCTWCLPQNLVGLVLLACHRGKPGRFRGALVTLWEHRGCASVGCFIFMNRKEAENQRLLVHEYGHTMQSAILGWFYLPVAGLPSVVWYALPALRKGRDYYSFYTERWADNWGARICNRE